MLQLGPHNDVVEFFLVQVSSGHAKITLSCNLAFIVAIGSVFEQLLLQKLGFFEARWARLVIVLTLGGGR